MNNSRSVGRIAAALALIIGASVSSRSSHLLASSDSTRFTIRIENVSTAKTLMLSTGGSLPVPVSPGVWAVYEGAASPLFKPGQKANPNGIERQAEEGNASALRASIARPGGLRSIGVFAIPVGQTARGGLKPGNAYEFSVYAKPGNKLSFTMMFAESNDIFFAPAEGGITLFDNMGHPVSGDITAQIALWDAGTEVNEEPGVGPNQAHRQKAPNTGKVENGVVHRLSERATYTREVDRFTYPATAQVIRVTIAPAGH